MKRVFRFIGNIICSDAMNNFVWSPLIVAVPNITAAMLVEESIFSRFPWVITAGFVFLAIVMTILMVEYHEYYDEL